MNIREALLECRRIRGTLLLPSSDTDIPALYALVNQQPFKFNWERQRIWIGLRLKDPTERQFPPELATVGLGGQPPPHWLSGEHTMDTAAASKIYARPAVQAIRSGRNGRAMKYLFMNRGKWYLTKLSRSSLAATVCEMKKVTAYSIVNLTVLLI